MTEKCFWVAFAAFTLLYSCEADISPFSPPFLRAAGQKSPVSTFNYLNPQLQSGYLIADNPAYNTDPEINSLRNGNNLNNQKILSNVDSGIPFNSDDQSLNRFHSSSQSIPSNGYNPANAMPPIKYTNQRDAIPASPLNTNRAESVANQMSGNPNHKFGRPQLRQLEFGSARDAEEPRRTPSNVAKRNRPNHRVSEGHRLITRALWRIFDALMERNEKEALQGRMIFVENALKDMITSDSKLEGLIEMLKEENMGQDQRLDDLSRRLGNRQSLENRLEELEAWQLTLQKDQQLPEIWSNLPAYSSCPAPFETVNGECFYVAGEEKRSWNDARRDCSQYGGDLAAPHKLDSLKAYLQSLAYQPEYVWVGASRQGNGDWVWSAGVQEGRLVDMTQATWNEDLPSGEGNCMGLYEGAVYRAYDFHCSEEDLYVCQFFL